MTSRYSLVIEWSDEDQAYVVFLPEWQDRVYQPVTDGATYEEAASNGRNVLATLIEQAQQHGEPLPAPQIHTPAPAQPVSKSATLLTPLDFHSPGHLVALATPNDSAMSARLGHDAAFHRSTSRPLRASGGYRRLPNKVHPARAGTAASRSQYARRKRVIRIFPNRASAIRLLGSLLMEQDEQRGTGKRDLDTTAHWAWHTAQPVPSIPEGGQSQVA